MNIRKLILLTFLLISCHTLMAQSHFEYGVNFGYNLSSVSSNSDLSTKSGYNISGIGELYVSPSVGLRLKVSYDIKGFGKADKILPLEYNDGATSAKMNLNYVVVPLTVNYHFGPEHMFYVNAGGYGAILSSASSTKGNFTGEKFKKTDYGVSYGLGVRIPAGDNTFLLFELDGQNGFQKVNPTYGLDHNFRGSFNFGIVTRL